MKTKVVCTRISDEKFNTLRYNLMMENKTVSSWLNDQIGGTLESGYTVSKYEVLALLKQMRHYTQHFIKNPIFKKLVNRKIDEFVKRNKL